MAALLSGCTIYFDSDDQPGDDDGTDAGPAPEPTGERIDRECLSGVIGGQLVDEYWNRDELFLPWGCREMTGETVSWGPNELVSLFGTTFPVYLDPVRVQDGWSWTIADRRRLYRFGTGFPMTTFEHELDELVRIDFDGDGGWDWVMSGDGVVRSAAEPTYYSHVSADQETTLLTGKPYKYIAVADLSGSTLLDIFYATTAGQLGIATQTSPGQFTDQVLATAGQPQRMQVADVDGDGRQDVVGAAPEVFIYSTRAGALVQMNEPARAIAVGDIDGDGVAEPVFLTASGRQVRRVAGLTAPGTPVANVVLNTEEADALTVAQMDMDDHGDIALIHQFRAMTSWFELRRATSFGY